MKRAVILGLTAIFSVVAVLYLRADESKDLARLARDAVSADADVSDAAIDALAEAGPAGLEALFTEHTALLESIAEGDADGRERVRLYRALNQVGRQHDCHASRLYWYTDLEEAKSAANSQGKPILSLRLLGRLDEECSCANSRFFRTVLYANHEISDYLREHYVLHWKSVRPVPKVTIDFGDGRRLERTLTGNSIHYVLAADGSPVDALPGLLGPKTFLSYLQQGRQLAVSDAGARQQRMKRYHTLQARKLARGWAADLAQLGVTIDAQAPEQGDRNNGPVPAGEAAPLADSKIDVERPLLAALNYRVLDDATDDALWERIAALHAEDAVLDEGSRSLIAEHNPALAKRAMALAFSKRRVEDPLLRLVNTFQRSVAVDTVRNEYRMHRRLHEWFAAGSPETADVDRLNERVYGELFLTPNSDPWLGLVPADVYTALQNNGVIDGR